MKTKKWSSILCLILALVMVLAACGGTQKTPSDNTEITTKDGDTTTGTGSDKDTILFAITVEPSSLNPGEFGDSYSRLGYLQIYDTLLREKIGDRTTLEPMLAESYEFNGDGTAITFKIREGVKFQNGDTLTAEDVAFSLNRAITLPALANYTSMMKDAVADDTTHVTLNLQYAYSPTLNIVALPQFGIISKSYFEACEADGTNFGRNPMGTGPYVFKNWQNGAAITLEANANYWDGEPAIKTLEFRIMSDATTAAIALEAGDVDVFWGVDSADLPRLRDNEDVNVLSVQSSGFYYIAMNQARKPFDNEKVRQAIAYCIDRAEIIAGGADGVGWETDCMITPGVFGHQEGFKDVRQDFAKAKALLVEAGYPDGISFSMICPEASYYARPAQVIQEQLRQAGITLDLKIMERGAFNALLAERDYETAYYWIGAAYPDADSIVYSIFHKDFANIKGESNPSNVSDSETTALVEKARAEVDRDARYAIYGELSELNSQHAYYIPILTSTNSICAGTAVAGCYGHSGGIYRVADWAY